MELQTFSRDSKAANDGAWVDGLPTMGDFRIKVRSNTCTLALDLRIEKERAVPMEKRDVETGEITIEESIRISMEVQHEAIIVDWENLTVDGKEVPYSPEMAEKICMNPDMRGFRDIVAAASIKVSKMQGSIDGIVEKN